MFKEKFYFLVIIYIFKPLLIRPYWPVDQHSHATIQDQTRLSIYRAWLMDIITRNKRFQLLHPMKQLDRSKLERASDIIKECAINPSQIYADFLMEILSLVQHRAKVAYTNLRVKSG